MSTLETRIPPPVVALATAAAMWGAARAAAPPPGSLARTSATVACALAGLSLLGLAFAAFRRARTTINPVDPGAASAIVTSGVFGYTRNPMYLGMTAILTAWAIHLSMPWLLAGPLLFALYINRFQVIPEERVLNAKFGRAYADYRQRVRRWL